jgi:dCMP deaminase
MHLAKRDNWDKRYMDLARHIATWSKDLRKKVGAVAIGNSGQILAQGYNGLPRGMWDDPALMTQENKLLYTVHAEMNCIYNASLSGVSLKGSTMYVSGFPPCSSCAQGIVQSGIQIVYCDVKDYWEMSNSDRWKDHLVASEKIFSACGVLLRKI